MLVLQRWMLLFFVVVLVSFNNLCLSHSVVVGSGADQPQNRLKRQTLHSRRNKKRDRRHCNS